MDGLSLVSSSHRQNQNIMIHRTHVFELRVETKVEVCHLLHFFNNATYVVKKKAWKNLKQLLVSLKKIQGFNRVRAHDLAIPVQRSNQLSSDSIFTTIETTENKAIFIA
mgnify:CR=1 FL=1